MDSQNGIEQEKSEGDEENLAINDNFVNSGQCSTSSELDQLDFSCPKTYQAPKNEFCDEESEPRENNPDDSVTTEQNIVACDSNQQITKSFENPSGSIDYDLQNVPENWPESHLSTSPVSNNTDGSDREITLDPVSADDAVDENETTFSSTNVSSVNYEESETLNENVNGDDGAACKNADQPGPSDDREDISDEELDLHEPTVETASAGHESFNLSDHPSSAETYPLRSTSFEFTESGVQPSLFPVPTGTTDQPSESGVIKADVTSSNSSEGGDIIDLKLEDAALKSGGSSFDEDENKASKVSREDLEAVSDDELPTSSLQHQGESASLQVSSNLIEGGEQVSSSEDEAIESPKPASTLFSSGQDCSDSHFEASFNMNKDDSQIMQSAVSDPNFQSLDAEPISDEEDIVHDNSKSPTMVEGGEAGEIKSPPIGSPISEQGDLMLGEMEPVSVEEDSDTDGELPSGDENSKPEDKSNRDTDKFEYIESDEDVGLGETKKAEHLQKMSLGEDGSYSKPEHSDSIKEDYMETISDEEDVGQDEEDTHKKDTITSEKPEQTSTSLASSHVKEGEFEKRLNQSNFNEHQVELDYEETEGDDVEQKPPEMCSENKDTKENKDDGEDGEVNEDGVSEKDEGELSDDDCEEGEIKEPGSRKPFIKPVCRFFQRGNCTWGISCRFIHPGINDKGNYQMIEIPGFKPVGIHARLGGPPGQWNEGTQEEEAELPPPPPPPMPDVPHTETAWERGLRIAKEQRKKASERKEQEPDFEEKRLNLSVDEERELNKENERMPKIIPKDPYYDQQAYEVDEYYKIPQDPWHTGHYENLEVRYHREPSFSPQYREKPPMIPPSRYNRHPSPPIDKFGRQRDERRDTGRPEPRPVTDYPSPAKPADEWTDPWRRSKSPKQQQPHRKTRGHSRSKRSKRSVSDSSNSSRSGSRSSSGSSRSSRSGSGSSGSSSRSRSPPPGHPGMGQPDRPDRYGDQPRSMVSIRGSGRYNNYDNYRRGGRGFDHDRNMYNSRQGGFGGRGRQYNSFGRGSFRARGPRDHRGGWDGRPPRHRSPTPDRPLPYVRPRRKSGSSRSSSSRSRSRSRSKYSDSSRSRSSSGSSRSSSSSSSSAGSADSEHLYRDLASPSRNPRSLVASAGKHKQKQRSDARKGRGGASMQSSQRHSHHHSQQQPPVNVDRIPHPREPHPRDPHSRDLKSSQIPLPPSGGRSDSKYASRNAPQAPVKAKDPLKVVGQKSNIKLTLLPKQQQQSTLGDRPNPLASPPRKRHLSDREASPQPAKRIALPVPQASALRLAAEKAAKIQLRSAEKSKSPPLGNAPSNQVRSKAGLSPQKQPSSKSRPSEVSPTKPATKNPSTGAPAAAATSKAKKSMSTRREELLKQLKAVEDAIARKKSKFP